MDVLIALLVILDFMLATTLVVVLMAQRDMRYARQVREETRVKDYFRKGRWD